MSGVKTFEHKKCPFCLSKHTKKNGTRKGKQRYRCQSCHRRFDAGNRLNAEQLWQLYTQGKQTTEQLAKSYGCSRKTISRYLQKAGVRDKFQAENRCKAFSGVKTFEHKKCPFCGSKHTKKNGTKNHKQQYKCRDCQRQFLGGTRLNPDDLWHHYSRHKQTAAELAQKHNASRRTISRHLKKAHTESAFPTPKTANLVLDTTYFGRHHGVMVLLDAVSKQALFVGEVTHESNALYLAAITEIQEKGTHIQSITYDGRRGLEKLFPGIPMQLCQFHQMQIIHRYLTRNPKSLAARELKALALTLNNTTQNAFEAALQAWYEQHKAFLNERTVNPITHKSRYTHARLRSASRSLKRNLPCLFTFEHHLELDIQNTTNLLEGRFSDLKRKLGCHQGMKKENKIKFIKDYFSAK